MNTYTAIKLNLPWHTGHIGEDEFRREVVFEPNHNQVLTMITPDDPETAAYICKAVNSHEALVKAIKEAMTYIVKTMNESEQYETTVYNQCKQALKLAEEE